MRSADLSFVALACLSAGAALAGDTAELRCQSSGPAATRLCDALTGIVRQIEEPAVLTLMAEDVAPNHLRATLTILRDGRSWTRGPAELTIMDRTPIPQDSIETFAATLLKGAGL